MSKYQYDLKTSIDETLKDIVRNVEKQNNELIAVIYNESVKDELNKILSLRRKGALLQIKKDPGTVANYLMPKDSYTELCQQFGLQPKEFDNG